MRRQPAGSTIPRSPVRSHPSGANASAVASRIVEIPGHDAPPPEQDLPGRPGGHVVPVVVDDAQFEAGPGPPHRGGDGLDVVTGRGGRRGAAFGEPVAGDDGREGELVVEPADELDGDVGGAGDGHPQRRQVVAVPIGMVEDALVQRGRTGQDGHALLLHRRRARGRRRTPPRAAWSHRRTPQPGSPPSIRTCGSTGSP